MPPLISICHPSARPHAWRAAHDEWLAKCTRPERVEYLLAVHESEELRAFCEPATAACLMSWDDFRIVHNHRRSCSVDGWNTAADAATGKLIVGIADDFFPPDRWDEALLAAVPDLDGECVVGAHMGRDDGMLTHYIVTRKRYERYGYLLNPVYEALYCDNEFTDVAKRDGVLIDTPLRFEHRHPAYGLSNWDAVYEKENAPQRYSEDGATYERRKAAGFPR